MSPVQYATHTARPTEDAVARAYELLIQHPHLDPAGFAARLGCDEATVRVILDRLTELALVQHGPSEDGGLVAASPVLAMQQLLAREQELLRERRAALERSYLTLTSILPDYVVRSSPPQRLDGVPLEDVAAVRRCLQELTVSIREEVMAFTPRVDHPAAADAASRPLERAVLDRGKRMRTLYPHAVTAEPATLAEAHQLADAGAEVRTVIQLPMWLVVVDRETALVPKDPASGVEGGLLVRHEGMVAALVALFESYWERGEPLRRSIRPGDRSDTERMVLRLLATGAKDEAVARQLGQSVRTVRRVVADLMAEFGAASRFELAVRVSTRGWL